MAGSGRTLAQHIVVLDARDILDTGNGPAGEDHNGHAALQSGVVVPQPDTWCVVAIVCQAIIEGELAVTIIVTAVAYVVNINSGRDLGPEPRPSIYEI